MINYAELPTEVTYTEQTAKPRTLSVVDGKHVATRHVVNGYNASLGPMTAWGEHREGAKTALYTKITHEMCARPCVTARKYTGILRRAGVAPSDIQARVREEILGIAPTPPAPATPEKLPAGFKPWAEVRDAKRGVNSKEPSAVTIPIQKDGARPASRKPT